MKRTPAAKPQRPSWKVLIAITGLISTSLVGVLPAVASAATPCSSMQIVGVRGSGEKVTEYGGYGKTVKAWSIK